MTALGLMLNFWPTFSCTTLRRRGAEEEWWKSSLFGKAGTVGAILMGIMFLSLFGYLNAHMHWVIESPCAPTLKSIGLDISRLFPGGPQPWGFRSFETPLLPRPAGGVRRIICLG